MVLFLLSTLASAEPDLDTCLRFDWDYDPIRGLGMFRLYVRQEGSEYDFEHPVMIAPALPGLVTEIPCERISVAVPGRYYAVVTAWRLDGEFESAPSNEVEFIYNGRTPFPPAPPPPPSDDLPPLPVPPPPPPLLPPPRPLPPVEPRPPGRGGGITDSCIWRGTCR